MIKTQDEAISFQKMSTKVGPWLRRWWVIIVSSAGVGLAILGYEGAFTFTNHFDNPADCLNFCGPIHTFDIFAMLVGGIFSIAAGIAAAGVMINRRTR